MSTALAPIRQEVIDYLCQQLRGRDHIYVHASRVAKETSLSPTNAGRFLSRVAGKHRQEETDPCPLFEMERWRESNTRVVWRVEWASDPPQEEARQEATA